MRKVAAGGSAEGPTALVTPGDDTPHEIWNLTNPPGIKYVKGQILGKGMFATCYHVHSENSETPLACKIVFKKLLTTKGQQRALAREIKIHQDLKHPNVVDFHSHFADDKFEFIILELCKNNSLWEVLTVRKTFTEPEVRYFLRQICEGLRYLHDDKNVMHRDLKPANIFVSFSMNLKIGDFGFATQLDRDPNRRRIVYGTPYFISPEMLKKAEHGTPVDIWSLGCILYLQLVGGFPFDDASIKEIFRKIKACEFTIPEIGLSTQAKKLIQRLLQLDPRERPTAKEILSDDFVVSCFVPESLPVSALKVAPHFPATEAELSQKDLEKNLPISARAN